MKAKEVRIICKRLFPGLKIGVRKTPKWNMIELRINLISTRSIDKIEQQQVSPHRLVKMKVRTMIEQLKQVLKEAEVTE